MKNNIWVEKYRPSKFEDVIGIPESIVNAVNNNNMMHLLLTGTAGTGKTTTAKIIVDKLAPNDTLMLNASNERGIDTVRDKVKTFAMTNSSSGNIKAVFLDEADYMCLTEDTEVLIGSLNNLEIRQIKDLPKLKHIKNDIIGRKIMIPSFNTKTKQLENDKGVLLDSGEAMFYEIELEDGRKIKASTNHPFFDSNLKEIKVIDLQVGDKIVDLKDEIFNICPICKSITFPQQNTCSIDCANKLHSIRMKGVNNPSFGKVGWNKGLTKNIDERVAKQACIGIKNGNHKLNGGKWYGGNIWKEGTEEQIKLIKEKISKAHKGKKYNDYDRAIRSKYGISGFLDSNYRRHLPKTDKVECEVCSNYIKNGGADGIYVHHKDNNHENNKRDNLMFVCPYCHNMILHDCKKNFLEKGWKVLRQ